MSSDDDDLQKYRDILTEHGGNPDSDVDTLLEGGNLDGLDFEILATQIKKFLVYGRMSERERRGYMVLLGRLGKKR